MKKFLIVFFLMMTASAFGQQLDGATTTTTIEQPSVAAPLQVQQGSRPVPDPTALTAEAIRELRVELTKWIELQFANLEKQSERNQHRLDQMPDFVKARIEESEKLTSEKFKGLSDQQVQRDNNLALALTAQQKSVADQNLSNLTAADKAEKNFKEQIAGIQTLLAQQEKTSTDKLNDLKDQQQKIESSLAARIQAIESSKEGSGAALNWIVIAAGFVLTVVSIIGGIAALMMAFRRSPEVAPVPSAVAVVPMAASRGRSR